MDRIKDIVERLRELRRVFGTWPYLGNYEVCVPLTTEADELRIELDKEVAQLLLTHPSIEVRKELNKLDSTATDLVVEMHGKLAGRPRAPYHITAAELGLA